MTKRGRNLTPCHVADVPVIGRIFGPLCFGIFTATILVGIAGTWLESSILFEEHGLSENVASTLGFILGLLVWFVFIPWLLVKVLDGIGASRK